MILRGVLFLSLAGLVPNAFGEAPWTPRTASRGATKAAAASMHRGAQCAIPKCGHELHKLATMVRCLGGKSHYARILLSAGKEFDIDPTLLAAVTYVESSFRPKVRSRRGARGLMQLRPVVLKVLGVVDPLDPHENIMAGASYLRTCFERYSSEQEGTFLALAAYNIGPGPVNKLTCSDAAERFVKKVLSVYNRFTDSPIPIRKKGSRIAEAKKRSAGSGK
jgi:Transglycosylase SLT domain